MNVHSRNTHAADEPTRVRYVVLLLACGLAMITYIDRVCFAAAAERIAGELSLSGVAELKWAFTAFAIAYAVFEIPAGWLGDVFGPRRMLIRIVLWWSLFTALTGAVGLRVGGYVLGGVGALVVVRFLFGAGEAGAFPNLTRALHNWFPAHEAGTAQGWVWMSGRLAGGLTPLVWMVLVAGTAVTPALVSWRTAFLIFGLIGVAWGIAFAFLFRNRPDEHPRVNAAELAQISGDRVIEKAHLSVPWRAFARSKNLWLICIMYFCMVYGWAFHFTYLPAYMQQRYGLDEGSVLASVYKGGPMWVGAFGCLAGGMLVDRLIRRTGDRRTARRLLGMSGHGLSGVLWLGAIVAPNEHLFFLAVSSAALCNDMTLASCWAACQDIGQQYAGVTAACMNTIGTLGAAAAGWLTGTLVEMATLRSAVASGVTVEVLSDAERHAAEMTGFNWSFASFFAAYMVAVACWRFIDASKPIIEKNEG